MIVVDSQSVILLCDKEYVYEKIIILRLTFTSLSSNYLHISYGISYQTGVRPHPRYRLELRACHALSRQASFLSDACDRSCLIAHLMNTVEVLSVRMRRFGCGGTAPIKHWYGVHAGRTRCRAATLGLYFAAAVFLATFYWTIRILSS